MARIWIIPAGAGVLSALLFLAAGVGSLGAMILCNLATLPLFAMGLGAGLISAVAAGMSATVLVGAVGVNAGLTRGDLIAESVVVRLIPAATFAVMLVTPAIVLVRQALLSRIDAQGRLEWYPPGRLIMWLVGMGMALFVVATSFVSGGRAVEERLNRIFASAFNALIGPGPAAQLQPAVDFLSAYPSFILLP